MAYNPIPDHITALLEVKREPAKKKQFCKMCGQLYNPGDPVVQFRWTALTDDWGIGHEECFDSFDLRDEPITFGEWRNSRLAPVTPDLYEVVDPNQLALRENFRVEVEGSARNWRVVVNGETVWRTRDEKQAHGARKFIQALPAVQEALR